MKKQIQDFIIISNKVVNNEYYILTLQQNEVLPEIIAGQFVEVLIEHSSETFLRRPISIYDVDYSKNQIHLLIKINGKGTHQLRKIQIGEKLNLIYPLGNGYTISKGNFLLVGGGVGLAPLYYLAKQLTKIGATITTLIGSRSKDLLFGIEDFQKFGNVSVTTEDGSFGEKGFVTQHSVFKNIEKFDKIYTCGPDLMMKAVSKIARQKNIPCEVSLENLMACGVGACLCCVTETKSGNKCVCTEGPVFNVNDLKNY